MFKSIKAYIVNFFTKGHSRTLKAKKHASLSIVYRGIDLLIGLALVPLVLEYLDETRYGIWMVLISITTYFRFMNIGLANGLRNKLAESKAKGEMEKARHYVSTTYAGITAISLSFFLIFLIINNFLDWTKILNTSNELKNELSVLALIVFGSFSLRFILKIITTIAMADQKPSVKNLSNLLERIIKLIFVLLAIHLLPSSLLTLGIGYSITPIIILGSLTIYFFATQYKNIRPSLSYVKFSYLKDLMNLGIKFFVISIAAVILFTTDNLIITQLFGPDQVTPYQITHKYFNLSFMFFIILVQPLWSAVTDAFEKNDFKWIQNIMKKMTKVWVLFAIGTFGMLIISPFVFNVWIGDKVNIPLTLSISWMVFIIIHSYNTLYTHFINGVGKLKIQLIITIISIIFNIPLSIFLAKYLNMESSGVIVATTFFIVISLILYKIQYKKIINHKANGIWNK